MEWSQGDGWKLLMDALCSTRSKRTWWWWKRNLAALASLTGVSSKKQGRKHLFDRLCTPYFPVYGIQLFLKITLTFVFKNCLLVSPLRATPRPIHLSAHYAETTAVFPRTVRLTVHDAFPSLPTVDSLPPFCHESTSTKRISLAKIIKRLSGLTGQRVGYT